MKKAMLAKKIVPDVIPLTPRKQCKAFYETGAVVELGQKLTAAEVKTPPLLIWTAKPNKFYTVCMIDPDAEAKQWQHWLVVNIPGSNVCRGEIISEYIAPIPAKETGPHRYIILIYMQKKMLEFDEPRFSGSSGEGRQDFDITKFAEKYKLGKPVAGNFFESEYDDFVGSLYTSLGLNEKTDNKSKKKGKAVKK